MSSMKERLCEGVTRKGGREAGKGIEGGDLGKPPRLSSGCAKIRPSRNRDLLTDVQAEQNNPCLWTVSP